MLAPILIYSLFNLGSCLVLNWKWPLNRRGIVHYRAAMHGGHTPHVHKNSIDVEAGEWSHFLSSTYPTIEQLVDNMPALRIGIDAVELRVDLLSDRSSQNWQHGIAKLKEVSKLPIIFTVRTKSQLGAYPDYKHDGILSLLLEGVKAGVDWIDVEATLPEPARSVICRVVKSQFADKTRIIGSLHTTAVPTEHQLEMMYKQCALDGAADILKVVTGAATDADCEAVHRIGQQQLKPYIGICLGEAGQYARVLNKRLTPVTHELMTAAAPGQLTAKQLLQERMRRGLIVPKQYYLFGSPIQHSLSPAMHNGAFAALLMPHVYSLNEQVDVALYRDVINMRNFSGASVTIPHKETIIPMLHEVRGAARAIGAVNTIVVETCSHQDGTGSTRKAPYMKAGDKITSSDFKVNSEATMSSAMSAPASVSASASASEPVSRKLVGYNTDWVGMRRPISALLQRSADSSNIAEQDGDPAAPDSQGGVGLVVGAGGTARAACYAIKDLGLELVVANRSPQKAIELAERFGGTAVLMENLSDCATGKQLKVVISTLPAAANFTLPAAQLQHHKPVILDVVYKPANTSLIQQALANGCLCVQGASMLLEQAVEQFELWHRRRAPRDVMQQAVFAGVEKLDST